MYSGSSKLGSIDLTMGIMIIYWHFCLSFMTICYLWALKMDCLQCEIIVFSSKRTVLKQDRTIIIEICTNDLT